MPVGVDQISMPVYTHSRELASAPHVAPRHALHHDPISVLEERRWNHINIRALQRLFWRTLPSVSKSDVQPRVIAVDASSWSVVGPWWALEGEGR
jgi:hypothetical protein